MTLYTKPAPYTKPQTYDGGETAVPVGEVWDVYPMAAALMVSM